jgi:hypothetical protein
MVTGDVHTLSTVCSLRRRKQCAGPGHHHTVLSHDRVDQSKSAAVTHNRRMNLQGLQRHRPEQVDRQPGGLKVGIVDFLLDRSPQQPADVVTAE